MAVRAFALVLVASAAHAAPLCQLKGRPWLEGRVRGPGPAPSVTARTVEARRGQEIDVFLVAPGRLDGRPVVFSDAPGRGRVSWDRAGCGPLEVAWRKVEPRMQHTTTPAPNGELKIYANAVVLGPSHGRWIGFDRIEYFETPLDGRGTTRRLRDARPTEPIERPAALDGLGTMRLAATVRAAGVELSTPGAEDAPDGLISDRVFRYSFRSDDGLVGWLTSFLNVPYLFGSAGKGSRNQAERYLGADCADVIVAALRRAGHPLEYTSVCELVDALTRTGGPSLIAACAPGESCAPASPPMRFGREVRPGDVLALDYVGFAELPRPWDHVVVVVEDRGPGGMPDGVLGPEDLVADSGNADGLKLAPLGEQGAARVLALRPH
jgi:hypothetical protein